MLKYFNIRIIMLVMIISLLFCVQLKKSLGSSILKETGLFTISENSEKINTDNFFVKIKDEIIPIEPNSFTSQKTIIEKTPSPNQNITIENINICLDYKNPYDKFNICNLTKNNLNKLKIKRKTLFIINKQKAKNYLEALNNASKKPAQNARLEANTEGKIIVIKKEKMGYEIDIEKILNNLKQYSSELSKRKIIPLPLKIVKPQITSTNYKQIGIKEKIGSGQSNFKGSPPNRIHNIHVATKKFEGIILAPKEKFSFIKNLGEVNADTNYKEELVIKNNKTIPEFGGGVCQVSTTLFRAAVNAGLKITERRNHAYPVQYYSPQGTDATVYIPKPDLQFINNTPAYILIQPHFNGTILTFDIFGTSDGRQVETEGPKLLQKNPDGSKKYVWWQIIKDRNGKQIAKNGFWSFYQNAAKYHSNHHEQILTNKPKNWSSKEWKKYKREHNLL